jgi:hypothetical protein
MVSVIGMTAMTKAATPVYSKKPSEGKENLCQTMERTLDPTSF